ncbi:ion channel [Aetokthonos hydrillicola Thurmond2011]|jgi:inward rectifier potassium channel|uniref:Ion channel n=1 Tax=Aetokthonos hydrillicola Thurmond2011 TaxID=2712845 RepID=A0AAP5I968_9CYAN|nr:ion channel [Aetokthonos hydrillicola]MBO3457829.1 ATP-sensitive inward rectifier potassium channel 10 [Aetokthonos hydrillicola CCALA 1050]MBW4588313.1 ATP-sensitive inward rectifier potassium channel 10 [Aetokthonos hydrillicola CCALA 1050]MDR9897206.1 ion channel [Aetokthonos hydrillicola Thurmond2011]
MNVRLKRFLKNRQQRIHIKVDNGHFHISGMNAWYSYLRDPYHLLLTISWTSFLIFISIFYIAHNVVFALLYMLGGDSIANARPGSFLDDFFFSVQTLATIGYGALYPKTVYANIIVTIEAMTGTIGVAVLTGLAFARFSKPTARVMFSSVAVITPHEGVPTLIFRTANQRRNQIIEAQMSVYLMRDDVTLEGEYIRRIYDLKMLRHRSPSFSLSWSGMHPITESSPLYGITQESLIQTNTLIIVSLSGIDETVAQVVHARYTYTPYDILWNNNFVDIIHTTPDGNRYIDYKCFHNVVPLDS